MQIKHMLPFRFCTGLLLLLIVHPAQTQIHWTKYPLNPVMGSSVFKAEAAVQSFVMEDLGMLRMWYVGMDSIGLRSIGEALSFDGLRWYELTGPPVLRAGDFGSFDAAGIEKPSIIRDNDGYKMYY